MENKKEIDSERGKELCRTFWYSLAGKEVLLRARRNNFKPDCLNQNK